MPEIANVGVAELRPPAIPHSLGHNRSRGSTPRRQNGIQPPPG
jgi:hypothetical protein